MLKTGNGMSCMIEKRICVTSGTGNRRKDSTGHRQTLFLSPFQERYRLTHQLSTTRSVNFLFLLY